MYVHMNQVRHHCTIVQRNSKLCGVFYVSMHAHIIDETLHQLFKKRKEVMVLSSLFRHDVIYMMTRIHSAIDS